MTEPRDQPGTPGGDAESWESPQTRRFAEAVLAPLGQEEGLAAEKVAMAAVIREGDIDQERVEVYQPRLRIEKPSRRNGSPSRLVWIRIRDPDRQVVHEVSVRGDAVVEHRVNEAASPSFTRSEREIALEVAAGDPTFEALLNEDDIDIEVFNPGHGPARLFGVRFLRMVEDHIVEHVASAVVDLDQRRLIEGGAPRG